jgi:sortase A
MKPGRGVFLGPRVKRGHSWIELIGLLLAIAGLGISLAAAGSLAVDYWQQQLNGQWEQDRRSMPPVPQSRAPKEAAVPTQAGPSHQTKATAPSGADFTLRIPKLGYYAAVRQGVTLGVLGLGPGHYPSTAWPGQQSNVGVAAHNVFWIHFDDLRPDDEIIVEARDGTYRYRVAGSRVIKPSDSSVLAPDRRHQLTLTTCWPLWAGALAPNRFAISAIQQT